MTADRRWVKRCRPAQDRDNCLEDQVAKLEAAEERLARVPRDLHRTHVTPMDRPGVAFLETTIKACRRIRTCQLVCTTLAATILPPATVSVPRYWPPLADRLDASATTAAETSPGVITAGSPSGA
jgi:hypothetical protein